MLSLCAWRTGERAQDWRSDEALWLSAARSSPTLPRPVLNLAVVYGRRSQWDADAFWTHRAVALVNADLVRHHWMRRFLCIHVSKLHVLMPEPPSFSVECAP